MKMALVHDWLMGIGGDVRVLKTLHEMYPQAPIYCLYGDKKFTGRFLPQAQIIPTFVRSPSAAKLYGCIAVESLDLSEYDLVISTGSIFSKGLILRPKTYHINYCHSPTRQVWDLSREYRHRIFQHFLRIWDRQASTRVDQFVANSRHVQERIRKFYRRESIVIYPPVQNINIKIQNDPLRSEASNLKFKNYFLIISRLYKHKNIDIAIKAFNKLRWNLVIIGDGPEYNSLRRLAAPNVHLLGSLPDSLLAMHYSLCTGFLLPQEEDFGIAPIEAMMHGKPVLALRAGGALEYVQEGINGLFFDDPHEAVLADGIRRLSETNFNSDTIKKTVNRFSIDNFINNFKLQILNFK